MGRLTRAFGALIGKKDALQDLLSLFSYTFDSKAGQAISVDSALQVGAVLACTRVLAEGIAQMPLKVYREDDKGGTKDLATDTPIYRLLFRKPNDWQTSFDFRETLMYHCVLTGNAFAFINRDTRGNIIELLPMVPNRVRVRQDSKFRLSYEITDQSGTFATLGQKDMFHLRGPSWNAIHGLSIIRLARESIGLSMAIEEGQSRLHRNGVNPGGIISLNGTLTQAAKEKLRDKLQELHAGDANAGRILILDQAAKFDRMTMTAVDAQTMLARQHQVEEVCRAFRVFPQLIGHTEKTMSYASSEQFFLAHVVHGLAPWAERWEQAIHRDLLQDDTLFAKLNFQGLLRGDSKSRAEFYKSAIESGWMTRNEAREKEDFNPLKGLDVPLMPLNAGDGSMPPIRATPNPAPGAVAKPDPFVDPGTAGKLRELLERAALDHSLELKIGRVLSALNEKRVTDARDALNDVLATLPASDDPLLLPPT